LAALNVKLSDFEIKQLLEKYKTPEGLIDYKTFCESVEKVFFEEDAAQDALEKHRSKPV
jgi:hypothetical protein